MCKLLRFLTCVCLLTLCLSATTIAAEKPNIVLVMTDDQGFGDIGVQGNDKISTPNLDRFATEGVEITRFYCSPVCAPTRASLMTGRYYYRSGVVHTSRGGAKMHGDELTIAERLKQQGYTTGMFGKWHLGDSHPMRPQDQGFDDVLWHKGGGIGQTPDKPNSYFSPVLWRGEERVQPDGYCTDIFVDAAMEFIEVNRERPFFVYLPTNAPHTPLEIAPEYVEPYEKMGLGETTAQVYGMVTNIDDNFGRLMEKLDELGLRENTVVIFFGDNGPQQDRYTAGLRGRKSWSYEGGIRVGAYFQWPGHFPGSRKLTDVAAHLDIAPTLMELAGVKDPPGPALDGTSLVGLLTGEEDQLADRTLFFQCHRGLTPQPYQNCAVVTNRYKMVGFPGTFSDESLDTSKPVLELYDITTDPGETTDLSQKKPNVLARLRKRYDAWYDDVRATRNFTPGVIDIGHDAENPMILCRYQDGNYRDGVPHGWTVEVQRSGTYRFQVNRGPLVGPGRICLVWQGSARSETVADEQNAAEFRLAAGKGLIDVWFEEEGKDRVVFGDNGTAGNVTVTRLD